MYMLQRTRQSKSERGGRRNHAMNDPQGPQRPPGGPRPGPNGSGPDGSTPPRNGGGSNWLIRLSLFALVLFLVYQIYAIYSSNNGQPQTTTITYSDFIAQVNADNVAKVTIQTGTVTGNFKTPIIYPPNSSTKVTNFQTYEPDGQDPSLLPLLETHYVTVDSKPADQSNFWLSLLLDMLPVAVIVLIILMITRRASQNQQNIFNFGRSRAKLILEDRPSTTFADVAGVDEAKHDLVEIVEFLRTPQKFQRLGGRIPRGVLLVGPPGTGKTLLAKAVAGEAQVPFFSMSGSEFVEVLVGVGASRVRDLFDQAKRAAPSIIFIDEIDAVGRQRGTSLTTNDEREQTLNQLLVEMDGFDSRQAVVVIAATNRPDGLDLALLRPGRFDRRVVVDRPDWKGRMAILAIHSRTVPLAADVDLQQLARATTGMVGADLANLVNEAALLAARRNQEKVSMNNFEEALDKIQLGAERPLVLSEDDLRVVAYHEGGHALVGLLTPHSDPVTKVTIVPRGQALGVTQYTPIDDRYNYSREYLFARIMNALGGRGAEDVALGSITTGAENDFQQVTAIAKQMVTRWGMSDKIGLVSFSDRPSPFGTGVTMDGSHDYSEETARVIDEEVHRIVQDAYERVTKLLRTYRTTLDRIAQELRRNESLNAQQLQAILDATGAGPAAAMAQATSQANRSEDVHPAVEKGIEAEQL
jgi:cell division protease FtsH